MKGLINQLEEKGVLKNDRLKEAFIAVDRINFVPENIKDLAYKDSPLVLSDDQTISQPSTVAFMLELLDVQPGNKILDIGAGSGWVSCLMGKMAGEKGQVFAYEINENVGMFGQNNVEVCHVQNVQYEIADAAAKWIENAPYDRIYSGAAFEEITYEIKDLLAVGGILVAPTQDGNLVKIFRESEDVYIDEKFYGFVFVPFIN